MSQIKVICSEPANQMLQPPAVQAVQDNQNMPVLDVPNVKKNSKRNAFDQESLENEVRKVDLTIYYPMVCLTTKCELKLGKIFYRGAKLWQKLTDK